MKGPSSAPSSARLVRPLFPTHARARPVTAYIACIVIITTLIMLLMLVAVIIFAIISIYCAPPCVPALLHPVVSLQ